MNSIHRHLSRILQDPIWYVAIVVGLILLTSYGYFQWWLAGVVALLWGIWLVSNLFGDEKPPAPDGELARLQSYIDQTLAYQKQIDRVIKSDADQYNQFYRQQLGLQLDTCSRAVVELVQRLILLRQDDLIRRDLPAVPAAIAHLEQRLSQETNAILAAQLEQLLATRRHQQTLLQRLQDGIVQTEIQLEHTLSLLGTIYSQILISQATNDIADYSRISASMDEEMRRLSDQLEALREVRGVYWPGGEAGDIRNSSFVLRNS